MQRASEEFVRITWDIELSGGERCPGACVRVISLWTRVNVSSGYLALVYEENGIDFC